MIKQPSTPPPEKTDSYLAFQMGYSDFMEGVPASKLKVPPLQQRSYMHGYNSAARENPKK